MDNDEEWRCVTGYEGLYMVSNHGDVMRVGGSRGAKIGRMLRKVESSNGYLQVTLSKHSETRIFRVHRLVAMAFLEPIEGKPFVNHIDGNKKNNDAGNLEWCTRSENALHSYGTLGHKSKPPTPESKARKIDAQTAIEIYNTQGTYADIARMFGISDVMARNIKIGRCWGDVTCQ